MKSLVQFTLGAACIAFAGVAEAQTVDQPTSIDPSVSVLHYGGDLGSEYVEFEQEQVTPGFGLGLNRYLTPSFDAGLRFNFGLLNYSGDGNHFTTEIYNISPMLKYKFSNGYILKENSPISPYVQAGPGFSAVAVDKVSTDNGVSEVNYNTFSLAAGAGLDFVVSKNVRLFTQMMYNSPAKDMIDGVDRGEGDDAYVQTSLGVRFLLGNVEDSDMDGVIDKRDRCPGTSALAKVDGNGCAIDSDRDGIADYLDACATVAGTKATNGCPDSDEDGIIDSEDACPQEAGEKWLNGCADTDKDGIANPQDQCPEEAGSRFNRGCPMVDDPTKVNPELIEKVGFAAKDIIFEVDKDVLRGSSEKALQEVVTVLNENPALNLTIEGHTDNTGTTEYNKQLSQERANAVKDYLVEAGISADRLEAIGYGETKPIAQNDGVTGRAENRRVVLILSAKK